MSHPDLLAEVAVSVPGSTMVMGEHAVLHGSLAVAAAMDQRIRLSLTPRTDGQLVIDSALGHYQAPITALTPSHDHRFIVRAAADWLACECGAAQRNLATGVTVKVVSQFSHQVGLGSSAAVSVAMELACQQWHGVWQPTDTGRQTLMRSVVERVRAVQGGGSGTDVAASVYGGVVQYCAQSIEATKLCDYLPVGLWYCGYKTPTMDVIAQGQAREKAVPTVFADIYALMARVTQLAIAAIQSNDSGQLGALMNVYHGLLDSLGVNDAVLASIVDGWRQTPSVCGAKISGSGLGDCVLALFESDEPLKAAPELAVQGEYLAVRVSREGARLD